MSSRQRSSQGEGRFKVKVIAELNGKCLDSYAEVGGAPSTECILVFHKFGYGT